MLRPPAGWYKRLTYYSKRYGVAHAVCSYAGRHWFGFWRVIGPVVTRPYLSRWLATAHPKIVNLGGGSILFDRWLTADVTPRADVYMDLSKPLPLPDNSIDFVFSEEVIEHLERDAGRRMLAECLRVLRPGGRLRLTTPSLEHFARRAVTTRAGIEEINAIFYGHGHRFIYGEAALCDALREAGFVDVTRSSYRDPNSELGTFDTHPARVKGAPAEWSQYWEATKPANSLKK